MKERIVKLEIEVSVPAHIDAKEVQTSIDEALDEPLNDWGDWIVTLSEIKKDEVFEAKDGRFYEDEEEENENLDDDLDDDSEDDDIREYEPLHN